MNLERVKDIVMQDKDVILFPSTLADDVKDSVLLGYANLIYKVMYDLTERDKLTINKLFIKSPDLVLLPQCQFFIRHICNKIHTELLLSSKDIEIINIDRLIKDMEVVLNNLAREGVLPINLEMDSVVFNRFRKHTYAMTDLSLSNTDILDYRKSMTLLMDWVLTYPHEYRKAINTLRSTSLRINIPNVSTDTLRSEMYIRLLNPEILRTDVEVEMIKMLNNLLVYHSFWMNIPDSRIPLKSRRRLGRYVSRLWGNVIKNEFRLDYN